MEDLNKSFDKKFSVFDGGQNIIKPGTYSSWVKSFIRQREKDLLEEFTEIVGEKEGCPCEKSDCPIRRLNQFREELIKKLEIISEEVK